MIYSNKKIFRGKGERLNLLGIIYIKTTIVMLFYNLNPRKPSFTALVFSKTVLAATFKAPKLSTTPN